MANPRRFRTLRAFSVALGAAVVGCRGATLCEPTSAALGQVVTTNVSAVYLAAVDKSGADVPHLACKAEANIWTAKLYVRETEDDNCSSSGKMCSGPSNLPNSYFPAKSNVHMTQGEFRVLGIGKGIALADCSESALKACNAGIDAYYRQQRAVRPPTIECRTADYQNTCEPAGQKPRVPLVAAARTPEAPPEDKLPATWVARLDDAKTRPVAIRALIHFHADAMARAGENAADPGVRAVLGEIVDPLAKLYVEGTLERGTRVMLIEFLAETRDARAGRAFIHACHGFAAAAGPDEEDLHHASDAIGAMKYEEAAPALGEAFAKIEAGAPRAEEAAKSVRSAMTQLKSVTFRPILLEKIGHPMERPLRTAGAEKLAVYQSQLYWQQTSADLLGALGDPAATKPLLKVMIEKDKVEVADAALLGLVKLGGSAVPIVVDVLLGKDAEMADFAKAHATEPSGNVHLHLAAAALALGAIGRIEGRAPMIQALKSADNEVIRAVIARELAALPPSPDSTKAFRGAYDKVPALASVWPSNFAARPALLTASARFYDAEMVPWLLAQASAAKEKDDEQKSAALTSAIKVMRGTHVAKVKAIVDKIGHEREKSAFSVSAELLAKCAEDVDCYLARLKDGDASEGFVGIKAAHMVGMIGDSRAGMEMVKLLPSLRNAETRTALVLAVDRVVQKDARAVADALEKLLVDKGEDGPLVGTVAERVVHRLRAR
jgi:hypothetical protein